MQTETLVGVHPANNDAIVEVRRQRLAHHEAAHAVMALAAGMQVESATIAATAADRAGHVSVVDPQTNRCRLERAKRRLLLTWAGPIGEFISSQPQLQNSRETIKVEVQFDKRISPPDFELVRIATDYIAKRCKESTATIQRRATQHVASLLRQLLWPCVAGVAESLLAHDTLSGERIIAICAAHRPATFRAPRRIELVIGDDMEQLQIRLGMLPDA